MQRRAAMDLAFLAPCSLPSFLSSHPSSHTRHFSYFTQPSTHTLTPPPTFLSAKLLYIARSEATSVLAPPEWPADRAVAGTGGHGVGGCAPTRWIV